MPTCHLYTADLCFIVKLVQAMANGSEWVFRSLLEFLKGPVWNIPILTFIEQKSIVFEPGIDNEEEYGKIHQEYKNLVDFMLGSYMEDMNITPSHFEKACGQTSKDISSEFHRSLFEQVWAADDYEIFKRMMTQKNIELQLQALEVLAQKYGMVPQSMIPDDSAKPTKEEAELMEEIMRRAKSNENAKAGEEQIVKATLAEKARLEAERDKEKEMLDKAMKLSLQEMDEEQNSQPTIKQSQKEVNSPVSKDLDRTMYITPLKKEVNPMEVQKRQEYLKKQRDRLMAAKKEQRQQQLTNYTQKSGNSRPKSSRAAHRAVDNAQKENITVDPHTLAFRRSLASRLKSEVVLKHST